MTELLKLPDAATICGVSRPTLYRLIKRGEFPAVKIGSVLRVPRSALNAWLADQSRAALESLHSEGIDHAA